MRIRVVPVVAIAGVALASCFSERSAPTAPALDADAVKQACASATVPQGMVLIRNYKFEPAQLRVKAGTEVTWVNCDSEGHTSTSDNPLWDSGMLSPEGSFSYTFESAGNSAYHCDPHPFMKASVIVE